MLVALYAFAFQIYCDISGYTDIARGTAKLMGFNLTINFRFPYFSRNISEFWRKWHMSMTYWFRDYVFFPLLTYTKGNAYFSSFVTLLCISLWHSISLNNIYRGVYFGASVVIYHFYKEKMSAYNLKEKNKIIQTILGFISWIITFHVVCLGWLFFYPLNTGNIIRLLAKVLLDFKIFIFIKHLRVLFTYICVLLLIEIWQAIKKDEFIILKMNIFVKVFFYWLIFWFLFGKRSSANLPFIYFGF